MPAADPFAPSGPFTVFFTTSENLGLSTTMRNAADILAEGNRSVLIVDGRPGGAAGEPVPEPAHGAVASVTRPDAESLTALGSDRVAARYDHVFVEAPVPDAPGAAVPTRLARLADSVVICFAMTAWSIDGAAALAEDLAGGRGGGPLRLLTLGLKSDVGARDRLRVARERVRRKFGPLSQAHDGSEIPFLEIPYDPLYMDSRRLAVQSEDAGTVTGLRPYYEQLADWLRERRPLPLSDVTIVHSGRHVPWAAWLEDRLGDRGIQTELRRNDTYAGERPTPGTALLFLSLTDADDTLLGQVGALSHADVRIVLVDEPFSDAGTAHHERIDLTRTTTEDDALRALYASLRLGPVVSRDGASGIRFPRVGVTNVPDRYDDFIDRDAVLADVEQRLREAGANNASLALYAPSGWGKTDTSRELCHRYGAGYDVVWWVRSWERQRVRRGLALLAGRLDIVAPDGGVTKLLAQLSDPTSLLNNGQDSKRSWLIVYDGVEDLTDLHDLLPVPHERGHVLITSRTSPPEETEGPRVVGASLPRMSSTECRALLRERLPELAEEQAEQVGSVIDFVPLALRLAAHCLAERAETHRRENHMGQEAATRAAVADVVEEFRTAKTDLLDTADTAPPVEVMVRVARKVARGTPGAVAWRAESFERNSLDWLLNAASLLTGRGMGLELLRSRRILSELARDDTAGPENGVTAQRHPDDVQLPDEHMVDVALWALGQVGLIDVDFDRTEQPLAQHHALRDVIRDTMAPREQEHIESVLRGIIAEYEPSSARDLPADWAREVYSLRLWEDTRPRVRRSLLRHLNALSQRGQSADLDRLLDIADKARDAWQPDGDEENPEFLRLLNLTARAHRLLGDYAKSRPESERALRGHRRLLGFVHPRTHLSADSHAATLRALGRFDDALMQVRPAVEGLTLLLGPRHPATVQVEHNLALTEALTGRVDDGLGRILERFRYRQAIGGKDDPASWRAVDLLAYLYRMTGRDGESRDVLRQQLRRRGDVWDQSRLRTEVGLAISERRLADGYPAVKDPRYGFEGALERDRRALDRYIGLFGPDRFDTRRCQFSYAADLNMVGKHDEAEQQVRECGDALTEQLGPGHPYTALCQVRHGVYLRALGRIDEAEQMGRAALNVLTHKLGQAHLWVAGAENSLAVTLAAGGRRDEAVVQAYNAFTRLRRLGIGHRPDARRVKAHHDWLTGSPRARPEPPSGFDVDMELPDV